MAPQSWVQACTARRGAASSAFGVGFVRPWRIGLAIAPLLAACAIGGTVALPTDGGQSTDGGQNARDAGSEPARDAGSDDGGSSVIDARGPVDAGGEDGGESVITDAAPTPVDGGTAVCRPVLGSLAIVELMIASTAGSDDRGEWFEVLNTTTCDIDLAGLIISSPTSSGTAREHVVTAGVVRAGQPYVFALSGIVDENHGLAADYVYGEGGGYYEVILNNGDDNLELRLGAELINRVAWTSGTYTTGHAKQFPNGLPPNTNETWGSWCDATTIYSSSGGTFYGTPGGPNGTCP